LIPRHCEWQAESLQIKIKKIADELDELQKLAGLGFTSICNMFLWKSFKEMCAIHMIHVMIRVFMRPMVSTSRVLHEPPGRTCSCGIFRRGSDSGVIDSDCFSKNFKEGVK